MSDESYQKLLFTAENMFYGVLPDYYLGLSKKIIRALANWIPEDHVEDASCDIKACRRWLEEEIRKDEQHSRHF
jgi:hypothetical protein